MCYFTETTTRRVFKEDIPIFLREFGKRASVKKVFGFARATGKENWEAWLLAQPEYLPWLLESGADINAAGGLALVLAARHGEFSAVKRLLNEGAKENIDRALVESAEKGRYSIVDLLLKHGVNPCALDCLAIKVAAFNGCRAIARLLADNGANQIKEAMDKALMGGYPEIAWMLKDYILKNSGR
ncbi:MAG: hypothetical protein COY10_01975 [Candidatus Portnoybacteria bacterium CG_4_10_14_0_2_um_filter_43_36]|uniref:Uncharacterized protein n=1 Tax=Candidatus Portnoybacteria bacterium CG_4_10_14_0_2_um_filter_43_36 TaxID=1974798 RepID=A0A2M7UD52_9BACT|nr:MAG: hypothetical protein COY10_01975 [Candidatus Portnoybacteria bacterium CG_4_10_14_0_2_um_filter_43_36]